MTCLNKLKLEILRKKYKTLVSLTYRQYLKPTGVEITTGKSAHREGKWLQDPFQSRPFRSE